MYRELRTTTAETTRNYKGLIDQALTYADIAGVPVDDLRSADVLARDLDRKAASTDVAVDEHTDTLARQVARGELSIDAALEKLAKVKMRADVDGRGLVHKAASKVRAEAIGAIRQAGDGFTVEVIRPVVAALIEQATEYADLPVGVVDHATAGEEGSEVLARWEVYAEIESRLDAAWRLADLLRERKVLPTTYQTSDPATIPYVVQTGAYRLVVPEAHRHRILGHQRAGRAVLVAAFQDGTEPGVYTAEEARSHIDAYAAAVTRRAAEEAEAKRRAPREPHGLVMAKP